jgi:hypothetical protein
MKLMMAHFLLHIIESINSDAFKLYGVHMAKKKDLISNAEFTKISLRPKDKHHIPLKNENINDDENKDAFEETLIGMEYDLEGEDEEENDEDYE